MFGRSSSDSRFIVGAYSRAGLDSNGIRGNEDTVAVNEKKGVFGVFDGNGKTKQLILDSMNLVAEDWTWARQKLGVGYDISDQFDPADLAKYLAENVPSAFFDEMIDEEENLDHRLRNLIGMFHNKVRDRCLMGTASTATLLFIDESADNLTVVNCGDSRAVLCRTERALQLTRDQKSDLNIGSEGFDQRQLTVHHERLDKANDTFVFLATDGVYNAFEGGNDDVVDLILEKLGEGLPVAKIAKHVVDTARKKEEESMEGHEEVQKIDDMSIIIISLSETLHLTPIEITADTKLSFGWRLLAGRNSTTNKATFWVSLLLTVLFLALCAAVLVFLLLSKFTTN